jgi:aminobenzoyl-glutamate transport protein
MTNTPQKSKKGILYYIEKTGNALPHPALLFGILAVGVLLISVLGWLLGWYGLHPATGERVEVVNLLQREGIHRIILEMVTNYTGFAPLGIVMVSMLGIGVAESSGLIKAAVNTMLVKADAKYVTMMVIFTGIVSSLASDIGYVLIIPMAGVIFHTMGRNPIVGMAATFAGVSAGFSANLIITPLDPLLGGISTEAARIIDPNYYVEPTANYFYLVAATIVLTIIGTVVTTKWVEPRFGKYTGDVPQEEITKPTDLERKGLKRAGWILLAWLVLLLIGLIPENGFFRGADGSLLQSPVLRGILTFILFVGVSAGTVFGFTTGKFKKAEDIILSNRN